MRSLAPEVPPWSVFLGWRVEVGGFSERTAETDAADLEDFLRPTGISDPASVTVRDIDFYATRMGLDKLKRDTRRRQLYTLESFYDWMHSRVMYGRIRWPTSASPAGVPRRRVPCSPRPRSRSFSTSSSRQPPAASRESRCTEAKALKEREPEAFGDVQGGQEGDGRTLLGKYSTTVRDKAPVKENFLNGASP